QKKQLRTEKRKIQTDIAPYKSKCRAFGFKEGSKDMSKCMFDLYKIKEKNIQNSIIIKNNSASNSTTRNRLYKEKREREIQEGLELIKRSLETISPPRRRNSSNGLRIGPNGKVWNCQNGICAK
ncbi:MAG: hypothetical protein CMM37_11190, partial [Rhodospirillaceae bacterium]|nr:hypothetical protein [Rhodospirillaceae bacterium]